MALQAPERRGNTLEQDLERAFALSRADKKLGEYFPPIENSSHGWQYDGTEHNGGGFDSDMYAFRTRGQVKKEWEVSVVQWARERDDADKGWTAEQAARNAEARNEDGKMRTIWAPEDADVEEAKKEAEKAWAREQMELEGLAPPSAKTKRRTSSYQPVNVVTPVNARRLSEQYNSRPNLGEESPVARTAAWLNGNGDRAGVKDLRSDPTEQNELYTMDTYEEEMRRKRKSERPRSRASESAGYSTPARRPSLAASSSKAPSLPSKVLYPDGSVTSLNSPRSDVQTMSREPSLREPSIRAPSTREPSTREPSVRGPSRASRASRTSRVSDTTEHTEKPVRRKSLLSMISVPMTEEASIPPSLPSKAYGRESPDSMETESRQSPRSIPDDDFEEEYEEQPEEVTDAPPESIPEAIHVYSPSAEEPQTGIRSRPGSSLSRLMPNFAGSHEAIAEQRPLSYTAMTSSSYVDLKLKEPMEKMPEQDVHVRSSSSSWRIPMDTGSNEMLFDEVTMPGLAGGSQQSINTFATAERLVSPDSQIAQSFRQLAIDAAADPTNSIYLREMSFTVPGMFSRSNISHEPLIEETEPESSIAPSRDELEQLAEEFPTPKRVTSALPHSMRFPKPSPESSGPMNIDKSLPGTPYTQTHSVVSTPEFDADALEAAQQTDESYYRGQQQRQSMPPEYSSGSKTPRGSMQKSLRNSYESFKEPRKSTGSLRSVKTGSTGAMGDVEPEEVLNPIRNAERRPSKRSTKKRHKPEEVGSDGSGSTVKASVHGRSQSSDDGSRPRSRQERRHERTSSGSHLRHDSTRRVKGDLPPGSAHTRVSLSDSESGPEEPPPVVIPEERHEQVMESPMSVDSSEEGAQYVEVPDYQEQHAPGRLSAHTFGLPTGTTQTFRVPQDPRNDSKGSLPLTSRPQSMAPSTRSNWTRASTLRASMRSPLPDISERDTTSELSFDGGVLHGSGSFGQYNPGTGQSNDGIPYDEPEPEPEEETPHQRLGLAPGWRADLWGAVAWDAAAARKSSSAKPRVGLNKWAAMNAAHLVDSDTKSGHKSSSSSLGEELKDKFSLDHRTGSYHDSHKPTSTANEFSSGEQQNTSSGNKEQGSSGNSKFDRGVGEVVDWHEDTEVGMAGVGAHGIRPKVSYRPETPKKSSDGYSD